MTLALSIASIGCANPAASLLIRGEQGTPCLKLASAVHCASGGKPETLRLLAVSSMSQGAIDDALSDSGPFFNPAISCVYIDELSVLQMHSQERLYELLSGLSSCRAICASSKDLEDMVFSGLFSGALFYKASVLTAFIPPLRERLADLPAIASQMLESTSHPTDHPPALSQESIHLLMSYNWPGNDAELEACLRQALGRHSGGGVIKPDSLPGHFQTLQTAKRKETLHEALEKLEREMVSLAIASSGGKISKAASELGITERILGLRIKKFGLDAKSFKKGLLAK